MTRNDLGRHKTTVDDNVSGAFEDDHDQILTNAEEELAREKEELMETFAKLGQNKKNRKIFEEIIKI